MKRFLKQPDRIFGTICQLGMRWNSRYHQRRGVDTGVEVADEDWDNLLILDGCRYDLFEQVWDGDETIKRYNSGASASFEFIEKQFLDRELHDTVYITANPHAHQIPDDVFHSIVSLLETAWDDELGTVLPEDASRVARQVADDFPNKRYIIHFMQPHFPFIGEIGRELSQGGITPENCEPINDESQIWKRLQYRELDTDLETIWEAYRENLEVVLSEARDLAGSLQGKSVITTDHGNLVGDRMSPIPVRGFGHPPSLYLPELVEIPWVEITRGSRRDIVEEGPQGGVRTADSNVEDRLEALGYR